MITNQPESLRPTHILGDVWADCWVEKSPNFAKRVPTGTVQPFSGHKLDRSIYLLSATGQSVADFAISQAVMHITKQKLESHLSRSRSVHSFTISSIITNAYDAIKQYVLDEHLPIIYYITSTFRNGGWKISNAPAYELIEHGGQLYDQLIESDCLRREDLPMTITVPYGLRQLRKALGNLIFDDAQICDFIELTKQQLEQQHLSRNNVVLTTHLIDVVDEWIEDSLAIGNECQRPIRCTALVKLHSNLVTPCVQADVLQSNDQLAARDLPDKARDRLMRYCRLQDQLANVNGIVGTRFNELGAFAEARLTELGWEVRTEVLTASWLTDVKPVRLTTNPRETVAVVALDYVTNTVTLALRPFLAMKDWWRRKHRGDIPVLALRELARCLAQQVVSRVEMDKGRMHGSVVYAFGFPADPVANLPDLYLLPRLTNEAIYRRCAQGTNADNESDLGITPYGI